MISQLSKLQRYREYLGFKFLSGYTSFNRLEEILAMEEGDNFPSRDQFPKNLRYKYESVRATSEETRSLRSTADSLAKGTGICEQLRPTVDVLARRRFTWMRSVGLLVTRTVVHIAERYTSGMCKTANIHN